MSRMKRAMRLRMALGGAVCGSLLGVASGSLAGVLYGAWAGNVGFGLDGALYGGGLGALAGAICAAALRPPNIGLPPPNADTFTVEKPVHATVDRHF